MATSKISSPPKMSTASGPGSNPVPLYYELSIAPQDLRLCLGCNKVLFEPRFAQSHGCSRGVQSTNTALLAKTGVTIASNQQPRGRAKKRRMQRARVDPGLTPRPAVPKRAKQTDLELRTPVSQTPDKTRKPGTVSSKPVRIYTGSHVARSIPNTPERVPGGTEPFRLVNSSPEQQQGAASSRQTRDVSDAILRLAGDLRAPRLADLHSPTPGDSSAMSGFAADVLFSAAKSFRNAPRPRNSRIVAGPADRGTKRVLTEEVGKVTGAKRRLQALEKLHALKNQVKRAHTTASQRKMRAVLRAAEVIKPGSED